jgi:hypothetical protein
MGAGRMPVFRSGSGRGRQHEIQASIFRTTGLLSPGSMYELLTRFVYPRSRVSSDVTRSHLDLTIGAEPVEESMTLSNKSGGRDAESTKCVSVRIWRRNELPDIV